MDLFADLVQGAFLRYFRTPCLNGETKRAPACRGAAKFWLTLIKIIELASKSAKLVRIFT